MVQQALTPANQRFSISSNEYVCRAIQRRQIEDFMSPSPSTGKQSGDTRFLRNSLIFGNVFDAYGGRTLGPWSLDPLIQEHLGHSHIHHFHDSEAETRFGAWTAPRQKNTITMPTRGIGGTEATSSVFGQALAAAGGGGSVVTRQMFNDQPAVYYAGSTTAGVYCWEAESSVETAPAILYSFAWTGAGLSAAVEIFQGTNPSAAYGGAAVFGYGVHKGALFAAGTTKRTTASENAIRTTTTGASWSDPGTESVANAWLEGTRFIDDGNTLWLVVQAASKAIYLTKSVDAAVTWTNYTLAGQGQVRSVGKYFDRSLNAVLVVLTEDGLYAIDETNYKLKLLQTLPFRGRGMIEWGGSLHIFMDAMHVYKYTQTEAHTVWEDVSPGGGEAMPSGKDFREDTDGSVVLASTALGIYAAWSGDGPTSGTLLRALCLFYDGEGWHFIWRAADTTNDVGYSARALALDPVSGDLLYFGAGVSGSDEQRSTQDYVRIIKAETDPRLLSANTHETAGYLETALISMDPVALSTTMWDMFYNTEGSTTTPVSLQVQYGVNGAVATDASQAAQTSNRVTVGFGTNSVGVNFTTVRFRFTFVATATVSTLVHAMELSYLKIPPVRWAYILDIDIMATVKEGGEQRSDYATVVSSLKTALGSATKLTCVHPHEGTLYLMPVAPWQAAERFRGGHDVSDTDSDSLWRVTLVDV